MFNIAFNEVAERQIRCLPPTSLQIYKHLRRIRAVLRTLMIPLYIVSMTVASNSLLSQVSGGSLSGTVTDATGATVLGARVIIENTGTHDSRELVTNSDGLYSAPNLTPATYQVNVSAAGFAAVEQRNVVITVGSTILLNFRLEPGSTGQTIVVTSALPSVDAETSSTGGVVMGPTVRQLPLNGRDWTSLSTLEPGVTLIRTQPASGFNVSRANRGFGAQMTINGNRPEMINFRLDGVTVNDYTGGSPASVNGQTLGVDAIGEFSVVTGNAPADYGRTAGAVVNAVTRNGTDRFHGSAYEFLRNSALDARNYFDGKTIPPFKRNQFGGSLGGPILRGKTFFFTDYEGLRQGLGVTNVLLVPSAVARTGHLSTGTVTVNPKVAPYLPFYPLPNQSTTGDIGTYSFADQLISNENLITGRLDQHFSDKNQLYGMFLFDNSHATGPDAFAQSLLGTTSDRRTAALEYSHIFSPAVVNTARFGFNRNIVNAVQTLKAINPAAADITLGSVPGRAVASLSVGGLTTFQGGFGATGDYLYHYSSYQGYDDLFWTKGAHVLKFGFSTERVQSNALAGGNPNGTVSFGSLQNFLTDVPTSFKANIIPSTIPLRLRQTVVGIYIQDDWHALPNLTLNLGLRYEFATVPTEVNNRLATLPTLTTSQIKLGSPMFNNPTLRDLSPRVGLSWDPFKTGKTAVRAGFGQYDVLPLTNEVLLNSILTAPYFEQGSSTNLAAGSFPNALYPTLTASSLQVQYVDQNPRRNYVLAWNLNIQRDVTSGVLVEVGYAGSSGIHLPFESDDVNIVQPTLIPQGYIWPTPVGSGTKLNPGYGAITPVLWIVPSSYNALHARVSKPLARGLQVEASYTFAKSLDSTSQVTSSQYNNSIPNPVLFNLNLNRGVSDFDIRQNLVANALWELPSPQSHANLVNWIVGGWQLGEIFQTSTGLPFTPTIAGDPLGTRISSGALDYPMRVRSSGCRHPVNSGNAAHYINLSCFAAPSPSTLFGNSGRNIAVGPSLVSLDSAFFKNNRVKRFGEDFNVQFRAELFNVINHTNFSPPTQTSSQVFSQSLALIPSAGALTSTATTSRQIQFGLKIVW